jgi:cytochrome-b5 reductase
MAQAWHIPRNGAAGMIAGGTGITPMFQVLTAIVKNPADTTQVRVSLAHARVSLALLVCG